MLIRKMWRDLRRNKTQFISIFLMSLLGMLVFVGINAESSGAAAAADAYYSRYNLCDIWIAGAGFSDDDVRTAKKTTGVIDVATALKKSSNIVSAKIALKLGNERFYRYLRAFNFGSKFGIELPGEEKGLLAPPSKWSKLTPTRVAIGQGIAVTALQMVSAYNAIANDGVMMKPYLVARVVSHGGEVIRETKPERIGCPIRPQVAQQVREMLRGVTDVGGTGTRARVKGYSVGGKTGTAQKVERGHYTQDYFASFIGFLPVAKPEIIVLVTVDRPRPQHTGSYVSAPAFAKIASASARYLEIAPDLPLDEEEEEKDDEPPPMGILTDPDILNE